MTDGPVDDGAAKPAALGMERLNALSDGVFAIAMTLLVLDVSVPPGLDDAAFQDALGENLPNLAAYALSFFVLAQFWRDHRYVLSRARQTDTGSVHLNLLGLGLVALLPFPTALLAEYGAVHPVAPAAYAAGVAALNAVHLTMLRGTWRGRTPDAVERLVAADLALSAAVFAVSVPVAFLSPVAGMLVWVAVAPCKVLIGARQERAAAQGSAPLD